MSKLAKATIGLMIVTMMSKILGFGRELVLTYTYGTNAISDVYITTLGIPTILFASIGTAISTTFIPLFYEIEKKNGKQEAIKFTNNICNMIILLSFILAILGFIFAEPLVKLFAMDFRGEKLELAIWFIKIMILGVIFIGLSNIMTAWLQLNGKFSIAGLAYIPYNIFLIVSILLSSSINKVFMPIGALIAMASMFFFQLIFAIRCGYKYTWILNFKDEYIKKMMILIMPVFIGVGVNQINAIVDRSLASTLGDGFITILNSANRLNGFVTGLFVMTIVSVVYPTLSSASNEENRDRFVNSIVRSINSVVILIIPISIGAIVLAEPVVRIVFERGSFNSSDTRMTAIALACYSIGMIGFGLREVLNKVFYSLKDTRTPMINGAIAMCMNIILNIVFVKILGYAGLALATSISSLICIILLFKRLKEKVEYFGQDKIYSTMIKSLIAAIVMGIVTSVSYEYISVILGTGYMQEAITLFVSVVLGLIIYVIMSIVLKIEDTDIILNIIRKLFKNK